MGSLSIGGYNGQRGRLIEVNCKKLDSVIEELNIQPDFVKIDVEGFEDVVLDGSIKMLSTHRPRIVLEVNPGGPSDRLTIILSGHGYHFYNITDHGPGKRRRIEPVDAFRNWLCLPS